MSKEHIAMSSEKTVVAQTSDLANRLFEASERPQDWDVPGLLSDAAHKVHRLARMQYEAQEMIKQVREASLIIQETASPISIIAMDLRKRLQEIEEKLTEWTED